MWLKNGALLGREQFIQFVGDLDERRVPVKLAIAAH